MRRGGPARSFFGIVPEVTESTDRTAIRQASTRANARRSRRAQGPAEHQEETGIPQEIAAREAARLVSESEQPFQAGPGHPRGCPASVPGDEVQRRSDSNRNRGTDPV